MIKIEKKNVMTERFFFLISLYTFAKLGFNCCFFNISEQRFSKHQSAVYVTIH